MFRFKPGRIYYSSHGYLPQSIIMPNLPREAWLMYPIYINRDDHHLVYMLSKKPGTFNGAIVRADAIFPECGVENLYPYSGSIDEYFHAQRYLHPDQIQKISGLNHAKFLTSNDNSDQQQTFEIGKIYQDEWGCGYRIQIISRTKRTATYKVFDGYSIMSNLKKSNIKTDPKTKREFILGYAGGLCYGHYWPDLTEYSSLDDCCQLEKFNRERRKLILTMLPGFNFSLARPSLN